MNSDSARVAQEYRRLHADWQQGVLDVQAFTAAVQQLTYTDPDGRWWSVESQSGAWVWWNGQAWVPTQVSAHYADSPIAQPPHAAPPAVAPAPQPIGTAPVAQPAARSSAGSYTAVVLVFVALGLLLLAGLGLGGYYAYTKFAGKQKESVTEPVRDETASGDKVHVREAGAHNEEKRKDSAPPAVALRESIPERFRPEMADPGQRRGRFVVYKRGVVFDDASGLTWMVKDFMLSEGRPPNGWFEAGRWAEKLNAEAFAGYTNWRLPSTAELASLISKTARSKAAGDLDVALDPVFSPGGGSRYWAADGGKGNRAAYLDFAEADAEAVLVSARASGPTMSIRLVRDVGLTEVDGAVTDVWGRARLFLKKGRPEAALTWARQAVAIAPDDLQAVHALGDTYKSLAWTDRARALYTRCRARRGEDPKLSAWLKALPEKQP